METSTSQYCLYRKTNGKAAGKLIIAQLHPQSAWVTHGYFSFFFFFACWWSVQTAWQPGGLCQDLLGSGTVPPPHGVTHLSDSSSVQPLRDDERLSFFASNVKHRRPGGEVRRKSLHRHICSNGNASMIYCGDKIHTGPTHLYIYQPCWFKGLKLEGC